MPEPDAGPEPGPNLEQLSRVAGLLEALEDAERVLVLTHDNPDPDALASAAALQSLIQAELKLPTTVAFGGIVGRAENRALIQEMGLEFQRAEALQDMAGGLVALVDTQPRAGNNSLPAGRIVSAVLDHHPPRPETTAVTFSDVRPDYGASCSILVEYLRAAGLEPDRRLATAMFYGIQSETMDLGRETSPADVAASLYLYPLSDPEAISRIRHARVPDGYFRSMHEALAVARRHGTVVVVPLGRLAYPDMVAEMADLFMKMDGAEWAIALGEYRGKLLLSVRTYDTGAHAGGLVQAAVGERGTAGGHGTLAGGQIDVARLPAPEIEGLRDEVLRNLLSALGVAERPAEPLVPSEEPAPPPSEEPVPPPSREPVPPPSEGPEPPRGGGDA